MAARSVVLAGVAMLETLGRQEPFHREAIMMAGARPIRTGLIVGLIAYAVVALFYSIFDLLAARGSLYTVDLLGKAVFRGLRDPAVLQFPITRDPQAIFMYNGLHLVISLLIGLVVVALIGHAERNPSRGPMVLLALVAGGIATVLLVGYLTEPMRALLPFWSIAIANLLAALVAGAYLLYTRPGLGRLLTLAGPGNRPHGVVGPSSS
jgi:hypothetical protein